MATWSEVLAEVHEEERRRPGPAAPGEQGPYDVVRLRHLQRLATLTGRSTIVYATDFTDPSSPTAGMNTAIHAGDREGFVEVIRRLPPGPLDVILHSPGGTSEGAEGIVRLLRSRFTDIRFIVPISAKSAATMLAMSGSAIVMDDASELGPIDPQRVWTRRIGASSELVVSPVWAMQQMWTRIEAETTADPSSLPKWYPIISQFGPSLLIECETAMRLANELVTTWLETGMMAGRIDPRADAAAAVAVLSDHGLWGSHQRQIGIDDLLPLGIEVVDLRAPGNADLRDHVWGAWHAISLTLNNTGVVKLFQNHLGDTMATIVQQVMQVRGAPQAAAPAATTPAVAGNRQARRHPGRN